MSELLVCIPTYNEALNIGSMVERVRSAVPDASIMIIDDESPDGTGEIADRLAQADPRVTVMHRPAKSGLATAYLEAFRIGLDTGYERMVEMDADGSHAPEDLPSMVAASVDNVGLVIGSRYVPGGRTEGWPLRRKVLSWCGNTYVRMALGLKVRDATAGYRVFTAEALRSIDLDTVASRGYSFQIEMAWRIHRAGWEIAEVPITFRERVAGASKMSSSVVREALWRTTKWGVDYRTGRVSAPAAAEVRADRPAR
ncbi:dolichol-phosphate mannosyltransferase [Rhodococcoides trifolii]|uniref:dolichyl-phosphate beta-D-mannosyltransferase n=1 Tax=Rhodococcoides trifolii TaxID=908250 RepID=A0A917G999_9NOCA|nr:polyprenol monophosphomannose synthase [Rhodococcus trifolii]GGG29373.1 dolichol-phosphate mannosyltransferase [Rhodococcus trifolii]